MRILKFIGVFLGTLLLVFLIVFGFNMDALSTLFKNSEDLQEGSEWVEKTKSLKGLTQYISQQPERVSITSVSLANPDSAIRYNEYTPRTMGRIANIFLLIEYARSVENGSLNPDEQISLADVEVYQLPYIDAAGHENAMISLKENNKVSESGTVALKDLVAVAIEHSDLAAADYLYFKFGSDRIETLLNKLELEATEMPLPFSGLYTILKPGLHNTDFSTRMDSLTTMRRSSFGSLTISNARQLANDEEYRSTVTEAFNDDEGLGVGFTEQRNALALFPKTTSFEMTELMQQIQQEELISEAVSQRIKDIMQWPLEAGRLQKDFAEYGALYDSRLGMANGIDYGRSTYTEEPFAQAVFFDDLQIAFWFHMTSNLMHQDFEQRLIWDPALRAATVSEIANHQPQP